MDSPDSNDDNLYQWRMRLDFKSSKWWNVCLFPFQDGRSMVESKLKVRCAVCLMIIKLNQDLSTSNVTVHFNAHHPGQKIPGGAGASDKLFLKPLYKTLTRTFVDQPTISSKLKKHVDEDFRVKCWKYVISSDSPFSIFDNDYFWPLTGQIDRISRVGMMPSLQTLRNSVVKNIETVLATAECVNFTTDGWQTRNGESLTTLTLHWLDVNFKVMSVVPGAPFVKEKSSGVNIASILKHRQEEFGVLMGRISSASIDQGSNYQKALRDVLRVPF